MYVQKVPAFRKPGSIAMLINQTGAKTETQATFQPFLKSLMKLTTEVLNVVWLETYNRRCGIIASIFEIGKQHSSKAWLDAESICYKSRSHSEPKSKKLVDKPKIWRKIRTVQN
jgi:hypothetical protein